MTWLRIDLELIKCQIFMLLKLESESRESKSAMQKICNRIRVRRFFGRIAIPGKKYFIMAEIWVMYGMPKVTLTMFKNLLGFPCMK